MLFAFFILYATYSYIMVCGAALMNAIMAIFAVGPARMRRGAPRRRARRRLEQFFRHAFLVFVYVLYTCVAAMLILKTVTPGGLAAQVAMTSPVAMLVLVAPPVGGGPARNARPCTLSRTGPYPLANRWSHHLGE